jgi:hypothetical protein
MHDVHEFAQCDTNLTETNSNMAVAAAILDDRWSPSNKRTFLIPPHYKATEKSYWLAKPFINPFDMKMSGEK